ncbi:MAG: carboxylating nicotinate-nucleotide diphosphorylase [Candidatus Helarchaeota archaeon]
MEIPPYLLKEKLLYFLKEDIQFGDLTSNLLISDDLKAKAVIIAEQDGIIAGINEAVSICELAQLKPIQIVKDGDKVSKGSRILEIDGKAKTILTVERTILNILMRMSGIATETNKIIEKVRKINKKIRIACTRKTTPGFRYFEKRAVMIGGGDTHRIALDDMVLIKENHLFCIENLENSIKKLKDQISFSKKIELEVENKNAALKGAKLGVDILMLDNFSPELANETINELKKLRNNIKIEISGNITPQNIESYAKLDIDIISMGYITHSIKSFNMSLDFIKKSI